MFSIINILFVLLFQFIHTQARDSRNCKYWKFFINDTLMNNKKKNSYSEQAMISAHVIVDVIFFNRVFRHSHSNRNFWTFDNTSFQKLKKKYMKMKKKIKMLKVNEEKMQKRIRYLKKQLNDALTKLKNAFVIFDFFDMLFSDQI